jgi:hypothetical protein
MRPHCSRQSRRSHCFHHRGGLTALTARRLRHSHCSTEARGDPATASDRVYLNGHRGAGPDLGLTGPDLGSDFFYFLKMILGVGWEQPIRKMIYFYIIRIVSAELSDTKNVFTADTTKRFCSSVS